MNNQRIVECVPNFSEGRDMSIIRQITDCIKSVDGVRLLDVDPGEATNRTVVTFVGSPEAVCEAAFLAVGKAGELVDMRRHHGAHPRMGATDVLPLIPVSGITLEECAMLARQLAERIAREHRIPCYCYEAAAYTEERRNLAVCRTGEYEGLRDRLSTAGQMPDYGARPFDDEVARTGCSAVGARDFLIAVNFNLNTGTLKATKAIGWYIDEYGIAQVSMNITNINVTPLHVAFDEVCRCAQNRGIRVTGTEIVGLIPKRTLIEAGRYFLEKQHRSTGIPESDIIDIAIRSMGLSDLKPFKPEEKVIEYMLEADSNAKQLVDLTVKGFAEETSRESPAPGGGTIAAYMGALGAALGTMVANLSSHKAGWDDRWEEFSRYADQGQALKDRLLHLVDEDTQAFNRIMAAFGMPKGSEEEKAARSAAIQSATLYAAEVPLQTMRTSLEVFPLCRAMAQKGNPNSISDAGVGALAARAAVLGAGMNVCINASSLKDKKQAQVLIEEANDLIAKANNEERSITEYVMGELKI
mgnify:CR=1 FL=1